MSVVVFAICVLESTHAALVQRIQFVAGGIDIRGPMGIAVDPLGTGGLYIADTENFRVRVATMPPATSPAATATLITYAGSGRIGSSGDSGAATAAEFGYPTSVVVDISGNVYICDQDNNNIRMVATGNVRKVSTIAGSGGNGNYGGDGGPATKATLNMPYSVAVDSSGNVYISDQSNHRIRYVSGASGIISTVVGTGTAGSTGDGGAATSALIYLPQGVALAANADLYIADSNRIRRREFATGLLTTVAGTGQAGYRGDDGLATMASLNKPSGVAVSSGSGSGDTVTLYIADSANRRVRMVRKGVITTLAGTGAEGSSGDGGLPTAALLSYPVGVAVTADGGTVYVADLTGGSVRRVVAVDQGEVTSVEASADLRYLGALAAVVPIIAMR